MSVVNVTKSDATDWLVFVASLPTGNGALRMRVWRDVKARGAALLRDGVYLLPASESARAALTGLAAALADGGGQGEVIAATASDAQDPAWRALFDRTRDWAALVADVGRCSRGAATRALPALRAQQRRLRQQFAALAAIDYLAGPAQQHAQHVLADFERMVERRLRPDEPQAQGSRVIRRAVGDYRGRQWATRRQLWIDRVASAWLIRRFIDPEARFLWLARPSEKPKRAIGFDFDGAEFTHTEDRVTFEVLRDSFSLDDDPALLRLGAVVHALDVGGAPVHETAAVHDLLRGLRRLHAGDDAFLQAASVAFDGWHAAFSGDDSDEAPAASGAGAVTGASDDVATAAGRRRARGSAGGSA